MSMPLTITSSSHHHSKSKTKSSSIQITDLPDDIIVNIFEHLTTAVKVFHGKRISEKSYLSGLSFACTSRRFYNIYPRVLRDLELWSSGNISDAALLYITRYAGSNIQRLILRKCNNLNSSLVLFSSYCSELKTLDLSQISTMHDDLLETICRGVGKTLRALLLRYCSCISDRGLGAIAEHCRRLTALDCGGLISITDEGLEKIAMNIGNRLSILILSWCKNITDKGLISIGRCELNVLCLRGLYVTNDGIEKMVKRSGKWLKAIDLMDCPNITNECFTRILPENCEELKEKLQVANERSIFQNSVSLLDGYVHVVGGINSHGLPSTLVCVLDAGNANAFAFQVLSKQALSFHSDDYKLLVTNSGLIVSEEAKRFLLDRFGIGLP